MDKIKSTIKAALNYIRLNWAGFLATLCFLFFFAFADLLVSDKCYISYIALLLGSVFCYIWFKSNPNVIIDKEERAQEQAEIEEKRKSRAAAVLDWNITYEWAVLLGKDK